MVTGRARRMRGRIGQRRTTGVDNTLPVTGLALEVTSTTTIGGIAAGSGTNAAVLVVVIGTIGNRQRAVARARDRLQRVLELWNACRKRRTCSPAKGSRHIWTKASTQNNLATH